MPGSAPTQPARNNRNDGDIGAPKSSGRQPLTNDLLLDVRGDHMMRGERGHRVHPPVQRRKDRDRAVRDGRPPVGGLREDTAEWM